MFCQDGIISVSLNFSAWNQISILVYCDVQQCCRDVRYAYYKELQRGRPHHAPTVKSNAQGPGMKNEEKQDHTRMELDCC